MNADPLSEAHCAGHTSKSLLGQMVHLAAVEVLDAVEIVRLMPSDFEAGTEVDLHSMLLMLKRSEAVAAVWGEVAGLDWHGVGEYAAGNEVEAVVTEKKVAVGGAEGFADERGFGQ